MKIIKQLTEMIAEEIEDAGKYARCALTHKDDNRDLADTFYQLSMDEMRHMSLLHNHVVKIIEEHRAKVGEPPASMMAVYEYIHGKNIEAAAEVKAMQALYKEA